MVFIGREPRERDEQERGEKEERESERGLKSAFSRVLAFISPDCPGGLTLSRGARGLCLVLEHVILSHSRALARLAAMRVTVMQLPLFRVERLFLPSARVKVYNFIFILRRAVNG